MDLLTWHYSLGLNLYLAWVRQLFSATLAYFSFAQLAKTLFSPWKRVQLVSDSPGFNLSRHWQIFSFNLISRFMGFIVRLFLLLAGMATLIFELGLSLLGLIIWLGFPPLSLPFKTKYFRQPTHFAAALIHSSSGIARLLDNSAGHFLSVHLGLAKSMLADAATATPISFPIDFHPAGYTDIIDFLLAANVWPENFFRTHHLQPEDLHLAASWWDTRTKKLTQLEPHFYFGRSLGLDLTLGYTPNLDKYSTDLPPLRDPSAYITRTPLSTQIRQALSSGHNILLVGDPGVGKKTALAQLTGYHLREVNFNDLLSQAILDLNHKKNILSAALSEAASAGNLILVLRDLHRFTNSAVEGYDFTDILETRLERRRLQIIAYVSPSDYERYISPNLRLRQLFEVIEVPPFSPAETLAVLLLRAGLWEHDQHLIITAPALRQAVTLADKYINDVPFPQKGIDLLDSAVNAVLYRHQKVVTAAEVTTVITTKTGIPLGNPTPEQKTLLGQLETLIHRRLVGQELAVSLIARSLRGRATGLTGENKPVGAFLFLGPTGVGKTETAKVLASVYFGSEDKILRFDMAEYANRDGLLRLMGSPEYHQPGLLTTAIKNHSSGLLLLDEIEKAPPEIYNLFLTLLDEGYITDAFGRRINCRHLFVIATSNAGSEVIRELVSAGTTGSELQQTVVEHVLQKGWFSPEFINRFDAVVVYQPLTREQLLAIAALQLDRLRDRLLAQNITLEIHPSVIDRLASHGYEPSFGARPMRRIIELVIGDLLSRAILAGDINPGDQIRLLPGPASATYAWEKI